MTRVLILGAGGMLGHKVWQLFRHRFDTYATVRQGYEAYAPYDLFDAARLRTGVDAREFDSVARTIRELRPHAVVNCIGIIKQLPAGADPVLSIEVNSLFPHRLAHLCAAFGVRLIHLSTDCVFSGKKGGYNEEDPPDAEDLYGRSKLLGEVRESGCLTLRTSMIGRELKSRVGLLEWFLSQQGGRVSGYVNAIFSSFTTPALATVLAELITEWDGLTGMYHLSTEPISKYQALVMVRERFGLCIEVEPYPAYHCDRSLDSTRFRSLTGFTPPTWDQMLEELVHEDALYRRWRYVSGA